MMWIIQCEERLIWQRSANDHTHIEGKWHWLSDFPCSIVVKIPVLLVYTNIGYEGSLI